MPQQIVQAGFDAPRAERVKQDLLRIGRLVSVVFVEKLVTGLRRIDKGREFVAQRLELFVAQHPDAGDISVFAVKLDLLVAESITPEQVRKGATPPLSHSGGVAPFLTCS